MQDLPLYVLRRVLPLALAMTFSLNAYGQVSRVAILRTTTTPKVVEDLVFAKLSERHFEVVARGDWLDEVADELELNLLKNGDQTERMQSLSRADVLLLLDTRVNEDKWHTKVTLLETRYGTRLGQKLVEGGPEEFVWPIVVKVEEARRKFRAGLQYIVAVAPLQSQNLTHEFDDLQSLLSNYLGEKFTAFPGTVVVEIEEAQEILKEIALTGAIEKRVDVLLVGGEFEFREPDFKQVDVKLTFDDGRNVKEFAAVRSAADYQQWLSDTVIRYHTADGSFDGMALRASRLGLSPAEQKKEFSDLARSFRKLGDLDRSSQLLDAALVLDPSDESLRRQAAKDFLQLANRFQVYHRYSAQMPNAHAIEKLKTKIGTDAIDVERIATRYMTHVEWLIRNHRLKSRLEFREFVRQCDGFPGVNSTEFGHRLARFVEFTAEAWGDLPIQKVSRSQLDKMALEGRIDRSEWWITAPRMVLKHFWNTLDPRFLTAHRHLMEFYPPQRLPHDGCILRFPRGWQIHNENAGPNYRVPKPGEVVLSLEEKITQQMERIDHEEIAKYTRSLLRSKNQIARLSGAMADVRLAWFLETLRWARAGCPDAFVGQYDRQKKAMARTLVELQALKTRVDGLRAARKGVLPWDHRGGGYNSFDSLKQEFAEYDKELETDYALRIPDLQFHIPSSNRSSVPSGRGENWKKTWGRLKFEPIAVSLDPTALPENFRNRSTGNLDPLLNMRNCDDFDVYWSNSAVFVMKERGKLEALPVLDWRNTAQQVASVKWDGRFVWITGATKDLYLLDSATWRIHKVPALPSHDWLKAEEVGVGQGILVGTLKPHYRNWLAKLVITDLDTGAPGDLNFELRVFHQARKVKDGFRLGNALRSNDFDDAFRCPWMAKVELADGSEQVLVGRWGAEPIMIDAVSLEMLEFPIQVTPGYDCNDVIYSSNGTVLVHFGGKAVLYRQGVDVRKPESLPVIGLRQFTVHEKWIYAYGLNGTWDRIHRETFRVENLVPTMLPGGYESCAIGNSAHYGLVGFGNRFIGEENSMLHSVSIMDEFRGDRLGE